RRGEGSPAEEAQASPFVARRTTAAGRRDLAQVPGPISSGPGSVTPPGMGRHIDGLVEDEAVITKVSEAPPLAEAYVEAVKKGEPSAWEAAYLAYGRALMGYLMVRLDNRDDAAEALSETFTRAIDKVSAFRGDSYSFRAWLFSIA